MNKDLERQLVQRYPWVKNGNTLNGYNIVCDCSDGWYAHIYDMLGRIEEYYKQNAADINNIKVLEIKEKYGELRVYADCSLEGAYSIIKEYELGATEICEVCGQPEKIDKENGWVKTICCNCASKRDYE